MDEFAIQIKTICLISILTGVMGCIIPNCRLKKAFNSFCAVVIAFTIMVPFSSFGKSAGKYTFSDLTAVEEKVVVQGEAAEKLIYTRVVEKAITESFAENGITADVSVECESTDDGFKLVSFTVCGCSEEEKSVISNYFNKGFGNVTVYFKEE